MPFDGGATVSIQSDIDGPFPAGRAYVSVSVGGTLIVSKHVNVGPYPSGRNTATFTNLFKAPNREPGKNISVFVVFLAGKEVYVGEPGASTALVLVPRCKGKGKSTTCTYATAKYWIETTRSP